ncbi:hypothetical protein GCM10017744_001000 [Streptomyces antimycoticus]
MRIPARAGWTPSAPPAWVRERRDVKDELRARVRLSADTSHRMGACHPIAARAGLRPGQVIAHLGGHIRTGEDSAVPGRPIHPTPTATPRNSSAAPQPLALSFRPGRTADRVHVPQPLPVGIEQPGLGVRELEAAAVFPDQRLYEPEMAPGHVREEMVLDLIVQPAQKPVRDQPRPGRCAR